MWVARRAQGARYDSLNPVLSYHTRTYKLKCSMHDMQAVARPSRANDRQPVLRSVTSIRDACFWPRQRCPNHPQHQQTKLQTPNREGAPHNRGAQSLHLRFTACSCFQGQRTSNCRSGHCGAKRNSCARSVSRRACTAAAAAAAGYCFRPGCSSSLSNSR